MGCRQAKPKSLKASNSPVATLTFMLPKPYFYAVRLQQYALSHIHNWDSCYGQSFSRLRFIRLNLDRQIGLFVNILPTIDVNDRNLEKDQLLIWKRYQKANRQWQINVTQIDRLTHDIQHICRVIKDDFNLTSISLEGVVDEHLHVANRPIPETPVNTIHFDRLRHHMRSLRSRIMRIGQTLDVIRQCDPLDEVLKIANCNQYDFHRGRKAWERGVLELLVGAKQLVQDVETTFQLLMVACSESGDTSDDLQEVPLISQM
jgi:hypothetical protein